MWLALAFLSAALLGLYDTAKKASLKDNAVIPVLFLNTVFSTLIFSPFIIQSLAGDSSASAGAADALRAHLMTFAKSCIVLSSWLFGYFGLKHLPITIVGPINATRPVLVLLGAMLVCTFIWYRTRFMNYILLGVAEFMLAGVLAAGAFILALVTEARDGVGRFIIGG